MKPNCQLKYNVQYVGHMDEPLVLKGNKFMFKSINKTHVDRIHAR